MNDVQLRMLMRKREISKAGDIRIYGHNMARAVRALYMEKHLKLVNVEVHNRDASAKELNFGHSDSIRTYDDLVTVVLTEDYTVAVDIREGTRSFQSQPSQPRATFHLRGAWWLAADSDGTTFVDEIERLFTRHAMNLQVIEEAAAVAHRVKCIEQELLGGVYVSPVVE